MTIKITLITPPDIFENSCKSIFLMNLPESEQTAATEWLSKLDTDDDINIYFYQGEVDVPWIFHAMGVSDYKYIDINNTEGVTKLLAGHILGKRDTYYSTSDPDVKAVYSHINPNGVSGVIDFFERTLGAEKR